MADTTNHPRREPGAVVQKTSVDAVNSIADNNKSQELIKGWFTATEEHRNFALYVVNIQKTNKDAARALRRELEGRRLLARELRLAAFGGGR